MPKSLSFFAVLIAVGGVIVSVTGACSDSPSGSSFTDTFPDSGPQEGGPGFDLDARVDDDAGEQSCTPSIPASYQSPQFHPPVKTSACSTDDLGGYYDKCYADPPSKECTDWLAAHKACGDCIEAPNGPLAVAKDRQSVLLSRSGCIAIAVKASDGGTDTCSAAFDAAFQCRRASCAGCFGAGQTAQHALQIFNTCGQGANTTGCKQYVDAQGPACNSLDATTDATCFPTQTEQNALQGTDQAKAVAADKAYVTRVLGTSCGK